jgi:hypothetical protein
MTKTAFLGLGIMGAGMAARLLAAGFEVALWNRSADKAEPLRALGGHVAATPAEAARGRKSSSPCWLTTLYPAGLDRSRGRPARHGAWRGCGGIKHADRPMGTRTGRAGLGARRGVCGGPGHR